MEEEKGSVNKDERGVLTIVLDLFRSLKLTIFLFILLAILSVIGTVIKQNASSAEYVQRYGPGLYEVLNFFNLFDMYHSWWFSAILLFLVINLVACSLQRLPGVWRQVFRDSGLKPLEDSNLKALPYVERIQGQGSWDMKVEELVRTNLKRGFRNTERIETETAVTFHGEKGRYSRLGVYITHFSLIVILIGGLIGSLFGFKGFVTILEGQTVNRIFLRISDQEVPKPLGFSVRCDDFQVTYYDLKGPERHVREYSSLLTILENGKEVLRKTVLVNHPLHYKGLSFYQSSYGVLQDVTLGVQYKNRKGKEFLQAREGETVPLPNSMAFVQVIKHAPQVHNFGEGVQVALFKPNQQPRMLWILKGSQKLGDPGGDDFDLSFEGITSREYTGLQVTKDPGVWVVWTGCALLIFGLIVSFFFSHQRIWARIPKKPGGEIVLAGSTNKNRVGFEGLFQQIVEAVRSKGQG